MGYALAAELAERGAEVTLVSGPVTVSTTHPRVNVIKVESAREMLAEAEKAFPESDITVLTAAVADYAPAEVADRKIKREESEIPTISLVKNPDIAAILGARKRPGQMIIGFALETDNEEAHALDKIRRKNFDAICLNSLRTPGAGFAVDTNLVTILTADGQKLPGELKSKREVAADIVDFITNSLS